MGLASGRITYSRFRVAGKVEADTADQLLQVLFEHRFQAVTLPTASEAEVGFVTGEHAEDVDFTVASCVFGAGYNLVRAAIRIDTHTPPPHLVKALRMKHTTAAAKGNPSGFASRAQKADAKDLASREIADQVASGRFRKTKVIDLLWDLREGIFYFGSHAATAQDQLNRLMRSAFGVHLTWLTSGTLAGEASTDAGRRGALEDVAPTEFTRPPADDEERNPPIPWLAKAHDLKDFLGSEFILFWLHCLEGKSDVLPFTNADGEELYLAFLNVFDLACAWGRTGKAQLRGELPHRLPEARKALQLGKWPRKAGMVLAESDRQWEFVLTLDDLGISGLRLPDVEEAETPRDLLAARLELLVEFDRLLRLLYAAFVKLRVESAWAKEVKAIGAWITRDQKAGAR
ncbi:MAG: hypothetical protein AAF797_06245 [Planctomycetota bacterium]